MTMASDVTDTAMIANPDTYVRGVPYEAFARLRARSPVVWVDEPAVDAWPAGPGFWAVLGYPQVQTVLRTPRVFSSSLGLTQLYDAPPSILPTMRKMMINMDPPMHARLRGLLTKAFAPRAVARLESEIWRRAYTLVDAVASRGECDFAQDVVAELPLLTLADILGVPEQDRWLMFDWANRVIGMLDPEYSVSRRFDPENATEMAVRALRSRPEPDDSGRMPNPFSPGGMADLYAYATELGEYKRKHPGDDVMSLLMQQVDADGGRASIEEFENLFWLFSIAGNETVRNALPGGFIGLLSRPEQLERLRRDRDLLSPAVEEMLRWWTAVIHFRRTATEDTEIAGVPIAEGQKVVVFFSSANRDESVFAAPDLFDLTRDSSPHMAFGHGPHFCIGAHLARQQMRAMVSAVLDRFDDIRLAGEPVRLRSNFQNGIKRMPIEWSPVS